MSSLTPKNKGSLFGDYQTLKNKVLKFLSYLLGEQLWTLTYFLPLYKLAAFLPYASTLRLFINKYAAWTSFNKELAFSVSYKKHKTNMEVLQETWNTEHVYKDLV